MRVRLSLCVLLLLATRSGRPAGPSPSTHALCGVEERVGQHGSDRQQLSNHSTTGDSRATPGGWLGKPHSPPCTQIAAPAPAPPAQMPQDLAELSFGQPQYVARLPTVYPPARRPVELPRGVWQRKLRLATALEAYQTQLRQQQASELAQAARRAAAGGAAPAPDAAGHRRRHLLQLTALTGRLAMDARYQTGHATLGCSSQSELLYNEEPMVPMRLTFERVLAQRPRGAGNLTPWVDPAVDWTQYATEELALAQLLQQLRGGDASIAIQVHPMKQEGEQLVHSKALGLRQWRFCISFEQPEALVDFITSGRAAGLRMPHYCTEATAGPRPKWGQKCFDINKLT